MQGRILAYQNIVTIPRKTLHIKFYIQKYGKTKTILLQKIFSCAVHKGIEP
jgi:hypothetical protein